MSRSAAPRPHVEPGRYQIRVTYNNLVIKDGEASDTSHPSARPSWSPATTRTRASRRDREGRCEWGMPSSRASTSAQHRLLRHDAPAAQRQLEPPRGGARPDGDAGRREADPVERQRTSTVPQIDDLAGPSTSMPPAGKVKVTLEGYPRELSEIVSSTRRPRPSSRRVSHRRRARRLEVRRRRAVHRRSEPPAGNVAVRVHGGPGTTDQGLPNVRITVVPVGATNVAEGIAGLTGADVP